MIGSDLFPSQQGKVFWGFGVLRFMFYVSHKVGLPLLRDVEDVCWLVQQKLYTHVYIYGLLFSSRQKWVPMSDLVMTLRHGAELLHCLHREFLPLYRQNYHRYYKIPINLFQFRRKMLGSNFHIIILYRQSNERWNSL